MWTGTMIRWTGMSRPAQVGKRGPNPPGIRRKRSKKKKAHRKKNRGKLVLDAAVATTSIKYPTDIDLFNRSWEHMETAVDILWQCVPPYQPQTAVFGKKARKSYPKLAKSRKWAKADCRKAIGEQLRCIELAANQLRKRSSRFRLTKRCFPAGLGSVLL